MIVAVITSSGQVKPLPKFELGVDKHFEKIVQIGWDYRLRVLDVQEQDSKLEIGY